MFSSLVSTVKPDSPAAGFDQYLSFHKEILQVVNDMEKIEAATSVSMESQKPVIEELKENKGPSILQEMPNILYSSHRNVPELKPNNSRQHRILSTQKDSASTEAPEVVVGADKKIQLPFCLNSSIKLAKEVENESGIWFMSFLEAALDSGTRNAGDRKKQKWPQSLILRVINWVEVEQSDGRKRPVHPRAAQVARKLRIKAKNPQL